MTTLTIFYGKTTPIRAVGKNQCALLAFAERHKGWHTAKNDRATHRAIVALHRKGCIEVTADQFRFVYP